MCKTHTLQAVLTERGCWALKLWSWDGNYTLAGCYETAIRRAVAVLTNMLLPNICLYEVKLKLSKLRKFGWLVCVTQDTGTFCSIYPVRRKGVWQTEARLLLCRFAAVWFCWSELLLLLVWLGELCAFRTGDKGSCPTASEQGATHAGPCWPPLSNSAQPVCSDTCKDF